MPSLRPHGAGAETVREVVPAVQHVVDARHVRHRASGRHVGQDDPLARAAEYVRGFGHEVDAAEHDELGRLLRGRERRELERAALKVRELDDLVALVVMPKHDQPVVQLGARLHYPGVQLVRRRAHVLDRQLLPPNTDSELIRQRAGGQLVIRGAEGGLLYLGDWDCG